MFSPAKSYMWFGAQGGLLPPTAFARSLLQGRKRPSRGKRISSFKINHGMNPRHVWQGELSLQLTMLQGKHSLVSPRGSTQDQQRCGLHFCRAAGTSWEPRVPCCRTTSLVTLWDMSPEIPDSSGLLHSQLTVPCPQRAASGAHSPSLPGLKGAEAGTPTFLQENPFDALVQHRSITPVPELPPHQPLAAVSMVEASSHCCDSRCPRVNQRGYLLGTTETRWWG